MCLRNRGVTKMADEIGCRCQFADEFEKAMKIGNGLHQYGDVPSSVVVEAISPENLSQWETICDCSDPSRVISAGRKEKNDWYLVTIKNLFTDRDFRKRGLASRIVDSLIERAKVEDKPVMFAADITYDNEGSKAVFRKKMFKEVTRFCWAPGEKPADVLHYVLLPSEGDKC